MVRAMGAFLGGASEAIGRPQLPQKRVSLLTCAWQCGHVEFVSAMGCVA